MTCQYVCTSSFTQKLALPKYGTVFLTFRASVFFTGSCVYVDSSNMLRYCECYSVGQYCHKYATITNSNAKMIIVAVDINLKWNTNRCVCLCVHIRTSCGCMFSQSENKNTFNNTFFYCLTDTAVLVAFAVPSLCVLVLFSFEQGFLLMSGFRGSLTTCLPPCFSPFILINKHLCCTCMLKLLTDCAVVLFGYYWLPRQIQILDRTTVLSVCIMIVSTYVYATIILQLQVRRYAVFLSLVTF